MKKSLLMLSMALLTTGPQAHALEYAPYDPQHDSLPSHAPDDGIYIADGGARGRSPLSSCTITDKNGQKWTAQHARKKTSCSLAKKKCREAAASAKVCD